MVLHPGGGGSCGLAKSIHVTTGCAQRYAVQVGSVQASDHYALSPRPQQNSKNDQPDDAPPDPRDVRVGRLPFEYFSYGWSLMRSEVSVYDH